MLQIIPVIVRVHFCGSSFYIFWLENFLFCKFIFSCALFAKCCLREQFFYLLLLALLCRKFYLIPPGLLSTSLLTRHMFYSMFWNCFFYLVFVNCCSKLYFCFNKLSHLLYEYNYRKVFIILHLRPWQEDKC